MPHPMEPLTDIEISRVAEIVRRDGGLGQSAWFETISLDEGRDRANGQRHAYVCCYEPASNRTLSGIVAHR